MSDRDGFLERVRQAVIEGNRAGAVPGLPERGAVGYQGGGPEPVSRFCRELKGAGGFPHVAPDPEAAWQVVRDVIGTKTARKIVLGRGGMVDRLELPGRLRQHGLAVSSVDMLGGPGARDVFFEAEVGISNVEHLVAETGSVVVASGPSDPRSLSLLPPVHIAIAERRQLLPDLFDLFDLFSPATPSKLPPSCLTIITGPSKTGDIDLRLVTGVHGPGEIHVVLCNW
jgi:L-lactate dehydrogenase complex protein LldG